jgi:imidazoleglycerol phosphate synthase glutamine amidotransferase subunit HisH
VNSGIKWVGSNKLQLHIGWDQLKTVNTDIKLTEIKVKDTVNFVYSIPFKLNSREIKGLQVDVNYITNSKLKKITKKPLARIWFNDYMSKMEWYEFIVYF